jgi:hypothetical protein
MSDGSATRLGASGRTIPKAGCVDQERKSGILIITPAFHHS